MGSLTYIPDFSLKYFFQPIYTDYANYAYFVKKITFKSFPLSKLLNQIKPNLAGMVLGWVPFRIMSDSYALHSEWLLLLKIAISSGLFCS